MLKCDIDINSFIFVLFFQINYIYLFSQKGDFNTFIKMVSSLL